jgi:hypothetical protein
VGSEFLVSGKNMQCQRFNRPVVIGRAQLRGWQMF